MKELLKLFAAFFKMGMFTFGGGLAMLPLIQRMAVEDYKWMTEEEMVDCVAVAQAMPGVIAINAATYIGNRRKGFAGALFATLGVVLPSFIIIILAVLFLSAIGDNRYVNGAFTGVKAASCGLILYSAYTLGRQVVRGWFAALLAAAGFLLVALFDFNAVLIVAGGALAGCLYLGVQRTVAARRMKEEKTADKQPSEKEGEDE